MRVIYALIALAILLPGGEAGAVTREECVREVRKCDLLCRKLYARAAPNFFRYCLRQCRKEGAICLKQAENPEQAPPPTSRTQEVRKCIRDFKICIRSCRSNTKCQSACRRGRIICLREARFEMLQQRRSIPAAVKTAPVMIERVRVQRPGAKIRKTEPGPPMGPGLLDNNPAFSPTAPSGMGTPIAPRPSR